MRSSNLVLTIIFMCCTLFYITISQNSPQAILEIHNKAPADVGVGPISWSETLAAYAQDYTNQRIGDCNMEHSGGPYGENLAEGYGDMNIIDAVKFWLTEKPNDDYKSNSCVSQRICHDMNENSQENYLREEESPSIV